MKRHKKQMKMQKSPGIILMAYCLLSLTACLPSMDGFLGGNYKNQTIDVSQMRTSSPSHPEASALYCKIGRGSALFGRDWYDFQDTAFVLHQGDRLNISVSRPRSTETMTLQAFFDNGGQKMVFCPLIAGAPDRHILCASLYTLQDDLQDGIKRTFDIPDAVRGGEISCAYDQKNLKPLETPTTGGN
jgi:hypothetical protein